jgi:hypothetical protein
VGERIFKDGFRPMFGTGVVERPHAAVRERPGSVVLEIDMPRVRERDVATGTVAIESRPSMMSLVERPLPEIKEKAIATSVLSSARVIHRIAQFGG